MFGIRINNTKWYKDHLAGLTNSETLTVNTTPFPEKVFNSKQSVLSVASVVIRDVKLVEKIEIVQIALNVIDVLTRK